jgi:hypothetical protein
MPFTRCVAQSAVPEHVNEGDNPRPQSLIESEIGELGDDNPLFNVEWGGLGFAKVGSGFYGFFAA